MSENSPINLGDLTKPATALIEKISGAIWLGYEPFHARRMAGADAYAAKLMAETKFEISEIEKRGLERLAMQAGKEQKNIEDVARIAIEHLNEDSNPGEIGDDWLSFFFDKTRIVSDEQMKILWGKILAGEANCRGSFSRRAIDFVASMSKKDADLITELGKICIRYEGDIHPFVYSNRGFIEKFGTLHVAELFHLEAIGFLMQNPSGDGFSIRLPSEDPIEIKYFHKRLVIERDKPKKRFGPNSKEIKLGSYTLSSIGHELVGISGAEYSDAFFNYIHSAIHSQVLVGITTIEDDPQKKSTSSLTTSQTP